MAAKVWNADRENQLIVMYEAGNHSTNEMAFMLGVSQPTIYNRLRSLQLTPRRLPRRYMGPGKITFSDHEIATIRERKANGVFVTDIAVELRKPLQSVRRVIDELGLKNSNLLPLVVGSRYGSLVVVGPEIPAHNRKTGYRIARSIAQCDCGEKVIVLNHALRCGNTKSCGNDSHRLKEKTPWIRIFHQYKNGAEQRGIDFSLSGGQMKAIVSMGCVYCGRIASNVQIGRRSGRSNGKIRLRYNGIDQVVPCGGYKLGNVVPCCRICNRAKSNLSLTEFIGWLQQVGSKITEFQVLNEAENLGLTLMSIFEDSDF